MRHRLNIIIFVLTTCLVLSVSAAEPSAPADHNRYLNAVREFADNVLQYGRDTYGPKHTPLFVDGLNIHSHEPVKWISPKGSWYTATETEEWILSNLALQQNLFRTLDSLTAITGAPKYRQAAMEAIGYAFENLRSPNGLLYWGEVNAYDAGSDKPVFRQGFHDRYSLKAIYPYYRLMWEVDPNETEKLIETIWAAHIHDWSNLDLNRIGPLDRLQVTKGWDHEYKGGPVYFESEGISFCTTGGDLCYAACMLSKLCGKREPLVWAKRIAHRYVETRDPRTGFWDNVYTRARSSHPLAEYFKGHTISPVMVDFGGGDPANRRPFLPIYILSPGLLGNYGCLQTVWYFMASELFGDEGQEFKQWALEELTARGKAAYRREDNSWVPMLADGTKLEGFVCPKDMSGFARKGSIIKAWQVDLTDFWAYALGYRVTSDSFLWEMARNIIRGNSLGDIGAQPGGEALLDMSTDCHNAHALLGFLCLYERTQREAFLDMARRIGDNILAHRFHKGFFVASNKHTYARFDVVESLSLLHLFVAIHSEYPKPPSVWPSDPRFAANYRYKEPVYDVSVIYTLTKSNEPPVSISEAAAIGDIELVRSLIAEGENVDFVETDDFLTPLYWAVRNGHVEVVRLLLSEGANMQVVGDWRQLTPLHLAVENGLKEIVELLLSKGADVDARRDYPAGDTPLHSAVRAGNKDIVELLVAKGADVNAKNESGQTPMDVAGRQGHKEISELLQAKGAKVSIHTAASLGILDKVKSSLDQGIDINVKDDKGNTPLLYAVRDSHDELAQFLLDRDADINAKDKWGYTPLYYAIWNEDANMVRLLVDKWADVNVKPEGDGTPLIYAVWNEDLEMAKLFISKGAKLDTKDDDNMTAFQYAAWMGNRKFVEFFVDQGVDVSGIHGAACMGDLARIKSHLEKGTDVDIKDELGWTPLFWAASLGREKVGEYLLTKGAQANAKTNIERTPLHQAANSGSFHLAKLLISKGADVNAKDKRDRTPLFISASAGHGQVVKLLITNGADVNAKAQNSMTPLHQAVLRGHKEIVQLLLKSGADVNAQDNRNRTPLDLAVSGNHSEIVDLLHKQMQVHDVAVTEVSAVPSCVQGDTVPVTVSITNEGDRTEVFRIALFDTVSSVEIAGREATLEPQRYKSVNSSDLILSPPSSGKSNFGWGFNIHGDVNRDSYDDLLVGAGWWNKNRGRAYLYFGGADMNWVPDLIFEGEADGDYLGDGGAALGDVNRDGYDDVIIGARGYHNNDGRLYIFFGGTDMDKEADVILDGEPGKRGAFSVNCLSVGDMDKDGYVDVLVGACGYDNKRGRVYLYYGGDPMDNSADVVFEGEHADDVFGRNATIGQDVDGDGYRDILIGARTAPDGTRNGRAYLFYGADRDKMDAVCDMTFIPPVGRPREFGSSLDIYDIDSDGYADVVIGARLGQGAVFVYWGNERDKMDAVADVTILGEPLSSLGGDRLFCSDFNKDGYGDIAVGAYNWPRQKRIGRTYIYYGSTKTSMNTQPDVIFTGETESSWFGHDIGGGDFNNDGYTDLVAGAWGYNKAEGRAYVFYAPFEDKINITFNWDTTTATPGVHMLRASIAPVAGEEETADNSMTVEVEVKEERQ